MAFSKLKPFSFFPHQTYLSPQKSPPSQSSLIPFTKPKLSLQLKTHLLNPSTLPKFPPKTINIKEEEKDILNHHYINSEDSLTVAFPSVAFSNTLFFSSVYNVQVIVGADEPEENLINRFRREVYRAGIIRECRRRRFFECSQEKRKRKKREAALRNRRRRPQPKVSRHVQAEDSKKKKEDSGDDNWELLDIDLPYT